MFEDYAEYFDEPGEADAVIADAQAKLNGLLTDAIKSTLEKVQKAKDELKEIQYETTIAKVECEQIKEKLEREKAAFENYRKDELPKEFIRRMVTAVTGDFAPGDTVFIPSARYMSKVCGVCKGAKKVYAEASWDHKTYEFACPRCKGNGNETITTYRVEEKTVVRVDYRLCFEKRSASSWSRDAVYLNGEDWATSPERLYRTREEAEAAAKEKNDGAAQA